jgi:hypothetical protein
MIQFLKSATYAYNSKLSKKLAITSSKFIMILQPVLKSVKVG